MNIIHKNIKKIPKESAHNGSGARKVLLSKNDNISGNIEAMTKGYLEPGKIFDWHLHEDIDEYFIALEGIGIIYFENGKEIKYKPDDLIYIPANTRHKIEALGEVENKFYFTRIIK